MQKNRKISEDLKQMIAEDGKNIKKRVFNHRVSLSLAQSLTEFEEKASKKDFSGYKKVIT